MFVRYSMRSDRERRRASQGVALSDFCWSIVLIKEHLWAFLQSQGSTHGPVEIYGEMELLRLLDQFLDRGLCYATEGYEQYAQLHNGADIAPAKRTA